MPPPPAAGAAQFSPAGVAPYAIPAGVLPPSQAGHVMQSPAGVGVMPSSLVNTGSYDAVLAVLALYSVHGLYLCTYTATVGSQVHFEFNATCLCTHVIFAGV